MNDKKTPASEPAGNNNQLFGKNNYIWILAGLGMIALGLLLMVGGGSDDPTVFREDAIYSFRRITLAPVFILIGLALQVVAIFRKP